MRYVCLTCDYDGTIARNGAVATSTLQALENVRASKRQLILATGRELQDLLSVFPDIAVFDRVVAENGGILYRPASKELVALGEKPPPNSSMPSANAGSTRFPSVNVSSLLGIPTKPQPSKSFTK
jgi:hydroxymethylpyrimidine pyrophosphatase-like HAD family hydrolase